MAGTVMHLVIADRLLDELQIKNPSLFYCGNLAPDAIMARKNYVRDMKTHTHFKDGVKPYEFRIKRNRDEYLVRFMSFFDNYFPKDKSNPNYELYLGYIVHILADELYLMTYYESKLAELENAGIPFEDERRGNEFIEDVDTVDFELVRNYKFRYPMPDCLLAESDYEISGWITNEELISSKNYIIRKNFIDKHDIRPLNNATFEQNYDFIDYAVNKIPALLKDRFGI